MNYKIVEMPGFKVAGKSINVSMKGADHMASIPQFWADSRADGFLTSLTELSEDAGRFPNVLLGICKDFADDMSSFSYMIVAEANSAGVLAGLETADIPAASWAVFECVGAMPRAIQTLWGSIMSDFFPNEPYVHAPAPDIEVYPQGNTHADDYVCEVWVPVIGK